DKCPRSIHFITVNRIHITYFIIRENIFEHSWKGDCFKGYNGYITKGKCPSSDKRSTGTGTTQNINQCTTSSWHCRSKLCIGESNKNYEHTTDNKSNHRADGSRF